MTPGQSSVRAAVAIVPSRDLLDSIAGSLRPYWPQVAVEYYQPDEVGEPIAEFPWAEFDLLFVNHDLNLPGTLGLDWLKVLLAFEGCPPVVFIVNGNDDASVTAALRIGASDCASVASLAKEPFLCGLARSLDAGRFEQFAQSASTTVQAFLEQPGDAANVALANSTPFLEECLSAHAAACFEDVADDSATLLLPVSDSAGEVDETIDIPMLAGKVLDVPGYRIIRHVGEGGMASAYLAERQEDRLNVVLKIMPVSDDDDVDTLRRFLREYNLIGAVEHPNVVRIFERAFATDYAYIAMEYFDAGDLKQRMLAGIDIEAARRILADIARGLGAAHERNIVHRDVKPGNVLFRSDDSLALTDFGVSSMLAGPHKTIAKAGQVVGTPHYLSPEQIRGQKATARSDLYSLGILLVEMVTGSKPFRGKKLSDVLHGHLHGPIPQLPPNHEALQGLVEGLLAKDPDDRFQSTDELLAALA